MEAIPNEINSEDTLKKSTRYTLFTGATGLLGEYLLRDGMQAGERYAVLVRPSRVESARGRVESMLARCEDRCGLTLPRPVVLEGSLTEPGLGLTLEDRRWVADHCDRVLHNAASLIFYKDEKGEPERSNVEGTRNVLDLAENAGIRTFHHVSTAYVCGVRDDVCHESQLDVGQEFGNDYERSKVAAEKMVRESGFLDCVTVFRPAIIIGDSQTGYTSTYHGFFTPLKVAHVMAASTGLAVVDGSPLLKALGFNGTECKNFVPVDWVSAVMSLVMRQSETWGETYHLVPRNRVSVTETTKVFEEAIKRFYTGKVKKKDGPAPAWSDVQEMFRTQMSVYQSYWRNDPVFDYSNVTKVAPHLPCPEVDYPMLMRMAMFALENGFGWPKKPRLLPPIDIHECLTAVPRQHGVSDMKVGLQINGRGGGQWTLRCSENGVIRKIERGLPQESPLIYLNNETFAKLLERKSDVAEALESGAVAVSTGETDAFSECEAQSILRTLTSTTH